MSLVQSTGERHPGWCAGAPYVPCGDHLSEPTNIPATGGPFRVDDLGAMFPRAEVAAVVTEHGVRGVYLSLFDPTKGRDGDWVGVVFTPAEICRLLVAAQAKAELAEAPVGWVGCEPARVAA